MLKEQELGNNTAGRTTTTFVRRGQAYILCQQIPQRRVVQHGVGQQHRSIVSDAGPDMARDRLASGQDPARCLDWI